MKLQFEDLQIGKIKLKIYDGIENFLGIKVIADIFTFSKSEGEKQKKIGEATIYIYDEQYGKIAEAVHSFSERHDFIMQEVVIINSDDKENRKMTLESNHYVRSQNNKVQVSGRVALLDDIAMFKGGTMNSNLKIDLFKKLISQIFISLKVDFVISLKDSYVPANNDFPHVRRKGIPLKVEQKHENSIFMNGVWKETEKELEASGFVRTGENGFVIKTNLV